MVKASLLSPKAREGTQVKRGIICCDPYIRWPVSVQREMFKGLLFPELRKWGELNSKVDLLYGNEWLISE